MPTYEYKCKACSHQFEQFQSMKDAPLRKCPKCGKNALERLIGIGAAVIFKGSGFYQTDYRSDSYKKSAEAETKPASSEKSGDKSDKPKSDAAASTTKSEPASKSETAKPAAGPKPKKPNKKGT